MKTVFDGLPDDGWVCCGATGLTVVDEPWDQETMGFAMADRLGADASAPAFLLRNTKVDGPEGLRLPFARQAGDGFEAVLKGLLIAERDMSALDVPTLPLSQRQPAREALALIADYLKAYPQASLDAARSDVERSEEEQAQIREEFPALINATPSQMREWSESPFAGENRKEGDERESARDALRRVIALKEKPMSEWTEGDYDDAVKAIAIVKRMSEVEQGDPIVIEGREGPSERDASLRDWGHWTDAVADEALRSDAFKVTLDDSIDVREGEWDGARGEREIFDWATGEDGETDWAKAAKGFVVADLDPPEGESVTRASFKLPIAYVENGELVGIGNAIRNALARLPQTEGLSDAVRAEAKAVLESMLEKLHAASADRLMDTLRGVRALPPVTRAAKGWTDKAIAGAMTLLMSLAPAKTDGADRVYRTCTMDFALDADARTAIDRALEIADEVGPRTNAAQVNSIAERLRADGFSDKVTADGRLIVTGYAARTGSQLYGDGKSTWYEYRSEDEVEKSLAGYANATFTDDHPPVLVTSDNWREYARGHVGTGAALLPPADDGHRYVKVTICVGDVAVIRKMRDGKVELSAGYTTIAVRDPGVDAHGVRYTYRQTDIQINHLALVDQGRAGHRARIYIDGQSAVFEIDQKEHDMTTKPKTDQMDPEAAMALLHAIKAYAYADGPEAAAAAMQSIATALELDPEMVMSHLGGGEMMEMDGVKLLVSKDAAARIRAAQAKIHGDAAKMAADHAALQGEVSALSRTVAKLEADKAQADMRELERQIAPLCPQLVATWSADKRPDSMTAMRVAAIVDLDQALQVDLDAARGPDPATPAPTFDAFVESLFRSTIRHASARRPSNDGTALPPVGVKIDTSNVYGKTATN